MTTHAQEVCEQFEANAHGMKSNQHAQLELTTKLLVRQAELEAQVKHLTNDLYDVMLSREALRQQLRMLTDNAAAGDELDRR